MFPRAFPWGLGDEQILADSSGRAGFPFTSIVSYESQVCGWEGWDHGGLSVLKVRKKHFVIEFPNAGNLHFPTWKRIWKPALPVSFLTKTPFSLVQ